MCFGRPGLCDAMNPTKGADLLKYLRKVNFKGMASINYLNARVTSLLPQIIYTAHRGSNLNYTPKVGSRLTMLQLISGPGLFSIVGHLTFFYVLV